MNDKYKRKNRYDSIVVGGGIAGLTATAFLARSGQKVLLIEKNKECGGLVNTLIRDGFHFDVGVRALINAGIIFTMLKDLNIKLEVIKSPVSLGIEKEILSINNIDSLEKYRELLKKLFPESAVDINEVIKIIQKIMKNMDVLYGIENPVFKDLKRDIGFIFKTIIPWFPRFISTVWKINHMNMPVEEYLKTIVKDPSLRDMIIQHFFKNTPSFFALSYFSLYLDYFYPRGGVGKLSEVLKSKILELGGEIKTETKITLVYPKKNLLKDNQGINYQYKNLIWAADLKTFYKISEFEDFSPSVKAKIKKTKERFLRNRGGDSVFTMFLEVDEPLESFMKIAQGHFFYTPSRKGLGETHREELQKLLREFSQVNKKQILFWLDKFTTLNTYEISIPGLKDVELVPPGKTGVIISCLAEYDLFKKIQQAGWLDEFTLELENRILKVLADSIYPMLKEKIIARFSFNPLHIERRIGSSEGAITGWAFQKSMPVVNNILISNLSVLTPIPSVYQAGQWAYSPAGVPMSILTGKLAADKIIKAKKLNYR
jgi:phytoene dehydrogenase-like protein